MEKFSLLPHASLNLRIQDDFYPQSNALRAAFESRFSNPYQATADRFCWDYWDIPRQYRLLRTPAENFFGEELFQPFLNHLLTWGRTHLGCQMISHPWMSVYLDGHYQALHSDVPHGPWSFVYSLTPWKKRKFSGGETLIAKPKLLKYFAEIDHQRSDEFSDFFDRIEPKMNRLSVFDPRYPHGVEPVKGVHELSEARLVIHGWFTEPRPMLEGALTPRKASRSLDQFAYQVIHQIEPLAHRGLLTLRLKIGANGVIQNITVMNSHLINEIGLVLSTKTLKQSLSQIETTFPKSSGSTIITLPIEFKN